MVLINYNFPITTSLCDAVKVWRTQHKFKHAFVVLHACHLVSKVVLLFLMVHLNNEQKL